MTKANLCGFRCLSKLSCYTFSLPIKTSIALSKAKKTRKFIISFLYVLLSTTKEKNTLLKHILTSIKHWVTPHRIHVVTKPLYWLTPRENVLEEDLFKTHKTFERGGRAIHPFVCQAFMRRSLCKFSLSDRSFGGTMFAFCTDNPTWKIIVERRTALRLVKRIFIKPSFKARKF